jgi:5S rRNA maturation endonuclease (ribonuclease M5)
MRAELPDTLVGKLSGLRPSGDGWTARCPVHEDRNPSLSISADETGKVLLHCHAGCEQQTVIDALGGVEMVRGERRDSGREWTPYGDALAIYRYEDEHRTHLFDVCRTADKQFPARRPDPTAKTGWRWSLGDTKRVLYRLPKLLEAVAAGQRVVIVEGEKDVHSLEATGRVATCNPGGAGKWRAEYAECFRDADVAVVADADKPGQAHARAVAASLHGVARRVQVCEPAEGHKDITEHLAAGLGIEACVVTVPPETPVRPELAPDLHELLDTDEPPYDWLVEGLLERMDRIMLTGVEGLGKSAYLRQIATCCAAGLHPVTFRRIRPLRVLLVDCENNRRQVRRGFRPLRDAAEHDGAPVPTGALRIIIRPEGCDLTRSEDAAWLVERVTAHRPDLLILGPLYRLHEGNPNDEEVARKVTVAIDAARLAVECAVLVEAHAGHGEPGKARRHVRVTGSSLYRRWVEAGIGMRPADGHYDDKPRPQVVDVLRWKAFRTDAAWPEQLRVGPAGSWPWIEHADEWNRPAMGAST